MSVGSNVGLGVHCRRRLLGYWLSLFPSLFISTSPYVLGCISLSDILLTPVLSRVLVSSCSSWFSVCSLYSTFSVSSTSPLTKYIHVPPPPPRLCLHPCRPRVCSTPLIYLSSLWTRRSGAICMQHCSQAISIEMTASPSHENCRRPKPHLISSSSPWLKLTLLEKLSLARLLFAGQPASL